MDLQKKFELTPALRELKEYSPLTFFIERFFFVLQIFSIPNILFKTRKEAHEANSTEEIEEITKKRGRRIDYYIIVRLVIMIILVVLSIVKTNCMIITFLCIAIPVYYIYEIMQATINMVLFDHLRIMKQHRVSGVTRTLVLSLYNYLELMILFGIIYSVNVSYIQNAVHPLNGYYFSVVTQLTIGYGDLYPYSFVGTIAAIQGIFGFILVILVLSRFITLMPKIQSVQKGDNS